MIRDEFEKAFESEFGIPLANKPNYQIAALWAAKWMANKIADNVEPDDCAESLPKWIRNLAKELDGEGR